MELVGNKVVDIRAHAPFLRKVLASRPNHTTGALDGAA